MRSLIKALVVAAGIAGCALGAQAAPVSAAKSIGVLESPVEQVQMTRMERPMMRRRMMMRNRMARQRMMRPRMMQNRMMNRRMMNRRMNRM